MKLEWYGERNCRELRRSGLFMLEMTVSAKACRSRQSWFTWGRGQQRGMVRLLWSDHLSCWDEFRQAWGDCKGEWVQNQTLALKGQGIRRAEKGDSISSKFVGLADFNFWQGTEGEVQPEKVTVAFWHRTWAFHCPLFPETQVCCSPWHAMGRSGSTCFVGTSVAWTRKGGEATVLCY